MSRTIVLYITLFMLLAAPAAGADYRYPYNDPYKATVYGTPPDKMYRVEKPVEPKLRSIKVEDRDVPEVLSHEREMFYTTATHKDAAPLIFIVAGTGAEHDSAKMRFLTQVFHQAGFHVVALSSPTHMNFLVSVSEHGAAGYVPFDVADLYRVMQWIKDDLTDEIEVTDYYVTGYSLGAMHAAFLAHKDSEQGDFNFKKALMINPPVSLYHSVKRLDSWLTPENLGDVSVHDEIERIIEKFSVYYELADVTDLDDNFLYEMVTHVELQNTDLRALIGVDFRVSSSSMIFASDICLKAEYVVPPEAYPLKTGTPLLPYAEAAFDISFENYLEEYLLPYLQYLKPGLDRYTMMRQCSLYDIRSYLVETDKIVLIGNKDDVILNDHDLNFIDGVFGSRAHLYPSGGHCGNMMYPVFVEQMLSMVRPEGTTEAVEQ
ncbi:alpha/beta fold hydrolase [Pseudodesulfovibrio sp. zrk46]|uniref:alpha/beta fold hydrolase n=1 Tax=Pseudodesulfovibrio sp. zrk46 TaxID=2725288 RepID=UPI001448CB44|nr:alpha/beta fold hydrolase [Pseudodesulfovibrio sp. zrk46]QJB55142.1 alpha/beta hydrolase [Pseudodesulfovibrio sp. zrk46]